MYRYMSLAAAFASALVLASIHAEAAEGRPFSPHKVKTLGDLGGLMSGSVDWHGRLNVSPARYVEIGNEIGVIGAETPAELADYLASNHVEMVVCDDPRMRGRPYFNFYLTQGGGYRSKREACTTGDTFVYDNVLRAAIMKLGKEDCANLVRQEPLLVKREALVSPPPSAPAPLHSYPALPERERLTTVVPYGQAIQIGPLGISIWNGQVLTGEHRTPAPLRSLKDNE